ncbi:hypothetical protein PIB30_102480, partial [Stylosanthes scabra]|nr:hypothetical protein [Stylosanthes scabra]
MGCEVLHKAVGQTGKALNAIGWEAVKPRQGIFLEGYGKGFALFGIGSIYEQHPVFEGIQVILRVCGSAVRLDLDRIPKLFGKFFGSDVRRER